MWSHNRRSLGKKGTWSLKPRNFYLFTDTIHSCNPFNLPFMFISHPIISHRSASVLWAYNKHIHAYVTSLRIRNTDSPPSFLTQSFFISTSLFFVNDSLGCYSSAIQIKQVIPVRRERIIIALKNIFTNNNVVLTAVISVAHHAIKTRTTVYIYIYVSSSEGFQM